VAALTCQLLSADRSNIKAMPNDKNTPVRQREIRSDGLLLDAPPRRGQFFRDLVATRSATPKIDLSTIRSLRWRARDHLVMAGFATNSNPGE
jgi:hypothetical protein